MGAPVPMSDVPDEHKFVPASDVPTTGLAGPTSMSAGSSDGYEKNWFDTHTQALATDAHRFLTAHGHPDLADAVHDLISKGGPHDATQAITQGVSMAIPGVSEAAPLVEESMPMVAKGMEMLGESGVRGMATRAAVTAGAGATTGGVSGAEQGALMSGAGEVLSPVASKVSGLGAAEGAAEQTMRESAADTVTHKALENELGTTTEQAQKLAKPTDVGTGAQELAGGKKALGAARQSAIREVGDKYNPIYGPIQDNPATGLESVSKAASDANKWAAERGARLTPETAKLLNDLEGFAPQNSTIQLGGAGKAGGTFKLTNEQIAAMNEAGDSVTSPQTIGTLRGKLGQIVQAANKPGSSAIDRRVLMDASKPMVEILNNAIPEEQKPLLQSINNEYAQINRIFPFKDLKAFQTAGTLPELGKAVFSVQDAPATAMALKRMTPEQKDLMRQAFASHVLSDSASPTETLSRLSANKDTVAALYPDSDFGKIDTWRKAMIAQKKFMQGPPNLPSQKAFEDAVQETIKTSGLTPEAIAAANTALAGTGKSFIRMSPYMIASAVGGYGMIGKVPGVGAGIAAYVLGHQGWKALADNPAMLDMYRQAITSGWTRTGGEALGRLMVGSVNNALRDSAPEHQIAPEPGPATKSIKTSQAEQIAPTPSASKRAGEVIADLDKGQIPDVHNDLTRGRLSMDEANKLVQRKPGAAGMLAHVPLTESVDALEVASPDERKTLTPLIEQKMRQEMQGGKYNRTMMASLAQRLQRLKAEA